MMKRSLHRFLDTPPYEIDLETRDNLIEVTKSLKLSKGGDGKQIERHLMYANLQREGKPVNFIYGPNTSDKEVQDVKHAFRGSISSGNLILTSWVEFLLD